VLFLLLVASVAGRVENVVEQESEDHDRDDEQPVNNLERKCKKNSCDKYIFEEEVRFGRGEWYGHHDVDGEDEKSSPCESETSNPRGIYTAHLAACIFKYHTIPGDEPKSLYLSNACSDSNIIDELKDKKDDPIEQDVTLWPDERVADFPRCYHVIHNEQPLLRHMCKFDLEFPIGTTHVSVDCTADKMKKKEHKAKYGDGNNAWRDRERQETHEFYTVLIGVVLICIVAGFLCLILIHRYALQPYLRTMMKRSKSDPELLQSLKKGKVEHDV